MATQHPWFDVYPSYVQHEIDPDHYPSIPAVLDRAAEQFPDRDAWVNMGVAISYRRMVQLSRDFAGYLQSLPDLKPGDRVAIMMPNLLL